MLEFIYYIYKDLKKIFNHIFQNLIYAILFYLSILHDCVVLVFSNGITS